jgi:hypothetical protein
MEEAESGKLGIAVSWRRGTPAIINIIALLARHSD